MISPRKTAALIQNWPELYEIVAEEYKRRLADMSPQEMNELYQDYYLDPIDANKD